VDRPLDGREIVLDSKQAHYLRQVLRLKPGYEIVAFDGRGNECLASIARLTREGGVLTVIAPTAPIPESNLRLILLQAIAKSEAMDTIVQKATELGVREIVPTVTEFCVVRLDEHRAESRLEHWRRIAQSACEQSGRNSPPIIRPPQALEGCLTALEPGGSRLALDPAADTALGPDAVHRSLMEPVFLLIGPEGGLSERDREIASRAGFTAVRLGPRTMRVETAAIAVCALAQAYWGDLR